MRPCPVCGKPADLKIGELPLTFVGPQSRSAYDLVHCKPCDVVYISPLPLAQDLDEIYQRTPQFDYITEDSAAPVVEFCADRVRLLRKRLGRTPKLSVLEIGAGLSWISRAAKMVQPESLTVAQDVTPESVARCPWVDHYIVDSADSPEIDRLGPYDIISMTHVIEHLPDPVAMLRRVRPIARGLVFLTAPHRPARWNGSIEQWKTYSYNHVPAHLQYFSRYGMRRAAEAAGFDLVHWDAASEEGQAFEAWLAPKA